MTEYNINPNKAMLLYDTGSGWEVAKLSNFKLNVSDDAENAVAYFVLNHSWFYRSGVPENLLEKIKNLIPTDDQLNDIEWCKAHQKDDINFGSEVCQIHIKH